MNPATPDEALLRMLEDPRNKNFSWTEALRGRQEIETTVSLCPDDDVRADLAFTYGGAVEGKLARSTQELLARDPSRRVRVNLARTATYEDLFEALLADPEGDVRRHCAMNPRASRDHIGHLITDRAARVRSGAIWFGVRYPDEEQLIQLANDKSAEVRWAVILCLRTPRSAIELIARDTDEMNRNAALGWLQNGPPYAMLEQALADEAERSALATPGVFDLV
jgi:hypothetical protein